MEELSFNNCYVIVDKWYYNYSVSTLIFTSKEEAEQFVKDNTYYEESDVSIITLAEHIKCIEDFYS